MSDEGTHLATVDDIALALGGATAVRMDPPTGGSRAAVAVVLRSGDDGAQLLFIRRASHPGDPWSGQMAFPGGRASQADHDLVATAVRETSEEVDLDLNRQATLLGQLDDLEAVGGGGRTGLIITPCVFRLTQDAALSPNQEVSETAWGSVGLMRAGEVDAVQRWMHEGQRLEFPGYMVGGHVVWGLTYRMLQSLFGLLPAS